MRYKEALDMSQLGCRRLCLHRAFLSWKRRNFSGLVSPWWTVLGLDRGELTSELPQVCACKEETAHPKGEGRDEEGII